MPASLSALAELARLDGDPSTRRRPPRGGPGRGHRARRPPLRHPSRSCIWPAWPATRAPGPGRRPLPPGQALGRRRRSPTTTSNRHLAGGAGGDRGGHDRPEPRRPPARGGRRRSSRPSAPRCAPRGRRPPTTPSPPAAPRSARSAFRAAFDEGAASPSPSGRPGDLLNCFFRSRPAPTLMAFRQCLRCAPVGRQAGSVLSLLTGSDGGAGPAAHGEDDDHGQAMPMARPARWSSHSARPRRRRPGCRRPLRPGMRSEAK